MIENNEGLIRGDKYTGLSIAGESNEVYQFELDGQAVVIRQTWQQQTEKKSILDLTFQLTGPVRFRIDVLVPEDCRNACVTLNNQLLISWFSSEIPDDVPEILTSNCQDSSEMVSTLHPGQFQSINFRWFDQDRLRFYFIR